MGPDHRAEYGRTIRMADTWMTYPATAAALGMTPESVRQRARREHWRKQLGNDGKALILVPADTDRIPAGDAEGEAPGARPVKRPELGTVITALRDRLADLEARATELRADLDRERGERLQERDRADRLTHEITSLAQQLAKAVQDAANRERDLRDLAATDSARLAAITVEMQSLKARSWWRRI